MFSSLVINLIFYCLFPSYYPPPAHTLHSASLLRKTSEQIRHSRIFQALKLGGRGREGIQIDILDFLGSQLGRVVTAYCPVLVIGFSPRTLVKHWTIQSSCEIFIHNIVKYWKIFTQVKDFDVFSVLIGCEFMPSWMAERTVTIRRLPIPGQTDPILLLFC